MDRLTVFSLSMSLLGLLLVAIFTPAQRDVTPDELLSSCSGNVRLQGTVASSFYSRGGNPVSVFEAAGGSVLAVTVEPLLPGENASVAGRASLNKGACWVFAGG